MAQANPSQTGHTVDFIPSETRNAVFLGNPNLDNMMHAIIALGAEIWADKRRLKVIEALLAARQHVTLESIEAFVPTAEQEKAWAAERDQMIKTTFGVLASTAPPARTP